MGPHLFLLVVLAAIGATIGAMVLPRLPLEVLIRGKWPLVDNRIVGGTSAKVGEFPFQVSLQRRQGLLADWAHICGGSVYDSRNIISAAHCVDGMSSSNLRIVAGEYSLSSASGSEQIRSISYKKHPSYDARTSENDIALLKVSSPLTFNGYVGPVDLPGQGAASPAVGTKCVVSGWGTTMENGAVSDILLKVTVPIVSAAECRKSYGAFAIYDSMICAGVPAGQMDACNGDSGGPLVIQGTRIQIGIVSWGYGCARPELYGVYTKVSSFTGWIQSSASSGSTRISSFLLILFFVSIFILDEDSVLNLFT